MPTCCCLPAALGSSDAAARLHIACCSAANSAPVLSRVFHQARIHESVQPKDTDAPVNFESIPKAEILLIKWPFLNRMLGLYGLKHCATFICFLLKCYVLSASPGQS